MQNLTETKEKFTTNLGKTLENLKVFWKLASRSPYMLPSDAHYSAITPRQLAITVFLGTISRVFFLATAAGRLILRCDLYADKFISMPLNLGWKPLSYWLTAVSQWVVLMAQSHALCRRQTKSLWVGEGYDLGISAGCVLTGPMFWAAVMLLPV